jgi:hypothetical protein
MAVMLGRDEVGKIPQDRHGILTSTEANYRRNHSG